MNGVFASCSGQTKDYKIGIRCFSAKHAVLRRKRKYWLARNQNNVFRVGRQVNLRTAVSACSSRSKRTSSSSHWKLTCSRHDIAEIMLNWRIITITHSNCLVRFTIDKTEILLKVTLNTVTQLHNINILNSAYVSLLSNQKWDPCAYLLIAGYDQKTSVNSAVQQLTHACQTLCVRYKQPLTLLIWFWF